MGISELRVSESRAVLGCLMFLGFRKQITPRLAWVLVLAIALLEFQASTKISSG